MQTNLVSNQKSKRHEKNIMTTVFRYVMISVLLAVLSTIVVSCSNDDKSENEPSNSQINSLYGTWISSSTSINDQVTIETEITIVFNTSGTVWTKYNSKQNGPGTGGIFDADPIEYRFEVNNNVINLYRLNSNDRLTSTVSFKIIGETLELTKVSGENFPMEVIDKVMIYKRK